MSEPTEILRLFVAGRPRTKGSLKPVHTKLGGGRCRVSLTESGEYATAWKNTMIKAIRAAMRGTPDDAVQASHVPYTGAVEVHSFFRFERLASTDAGLPWPVRETGEYAHGDEDKLRRNLLDALTQSGLLADDALVVGGFNLKRYVEPGEQPGVEILARPARPLAYLREQLMLAPRTPDPVTLDVRQGDDG